MKLSVQEFISSVEEARMPSDLPLCLQALWLDAVEDWDSAHTLIQDDGSINSAWVHAYLHRKEGDLGNARYWYSRAGKSVPSESLASEWESMVKQLLQNHF